MSLDNLTGRVGRSAPAGASPGGLVEATIATTPAGGEPVDVLIGGDARQRTGPCVWTPLVIDGEMFTPARGDPCFVQKARKGETVVVWWEPGDDREGVAIVPAETGTEWADLTPTNSYAGTPQWRRDNDGFIHLRGPLTALGEAGAAAFTLPVGARPSLLATGLAVVTNNAAIVPAAVLITTAGNALVVWNTSSTALDVGSIAPFEAA